MSSSNYESISNLLKKANETSTMLKRLNSNIKLYNRVQSLEKNLNSLEEKYKSLKISTCNEQCNKLNETKDDGSIDDFFINLILSKYNPSTTPLPSAPPFEETSAPPFEEAAPSAPPFEEE